MNDLELIRKFEPVICHTQGEMFYPCAVDEYIRQCSLWIRDSEGNPTRIAEAGTLTLEGLAEYHEVPPGHTMYLRFVQEPLTGLAYQIWRWREDHTPFYAHGRLARVGLVSRLIDSFFDLALLLRGTVPKGTTAAAEQQYTQMLQRDDRFVYYYRVIREAGYIILHYMFFYVMNDWRSTFYGVNDHEADWEQIFVYLSDNGDDDPEPEWVAYASHDYQGDNLRRRWDDPELHKFNGTHPVIYAGAGSHASYFQPGEYLTHVRIRAIEPLRNLLQEVRKVWMRRLGQGSSEKLAQEVDDLFSIPFVDYARGDGLCIGPDQPHTWSSLPLTGDLGWVENYRGLWGLDTKDPFGGERAPAGPKYNRNGSIRKSWHNPLGWSGLHKVLPRSQVRAQLESYIAALTHQLEDANSRILTSRETLRLLQLEVESLSAADYLSNLHQNRYEMLVVGERELDTIYAHKAQLAESLEACRVHLKRLEQHQPTNPQAHISAKFSPEPSLEHQGRVIEFWAAMSSGLLVLVFAVYVVLDPTNWIVRGSVVIVAFVVVESALRGRLARLLLNATITLALVTAAILTVRFLSWIVLFGLLGIARLLILENLRELRQR